MGSCTSTQKELKPTYCKSSDLANSSVSFESESDSETTNRNDTVDKDYVYPCGSISDLSTAHQLPLPELIVNGFIRGNNQNWQLIDFLALTQL